MQKGSKRDKRKPPVMTSSPLKAVAIVSHPVIDLL
jgi:hypothetical protein